MRFYTHIVGSLLIALLLSVCLSFKPTSLYLFIAAAAAPALDLLDFMIGKGHRRHTHNIFVLIGSGLLVLVNFHLGIAIFAAVLSHLILDLFSVHGCPLFYPLKEKKFVSMQRKNRIKTGSKREKAIFAFLLVIVVGGILGNYQVFTSLDEKANNIASSSSNNLSNNSGNNQANVKTITNVNIQADKIDGQKNITVKSSGNKTNILIKEVE
ncbi:metal-dependent hydrolase [Methanobacterium alcaliphilum]|uniref:metal-dependent hydrolase n=1 Tax=Methanobacterium alcaliphilum TaxID=392018 RepID=UPI00200AC569|nr:metal-dependent hydrolase [Methanobacterium alcaliphilum]MCK9150487.1 metal-dependent hydrolase [Methanobacterium alcaliphilum]